MSTSQRRFRRRKSRYAMEDIDGEAGRMEAVAGVLARGCGGSPTSGMTSDSHLF